MIEAIQGRGVNRATVRCDLCEREETVTCDYERKHAGAWIPNEGQIQTKLAGMKWGIVKGKHHCPTCEAKRKAVRMEQVKTKAKAPSEEPPREATPKQKREIIKILEDVIDEAAGRYVSGESDDSVAEALNVMPGWVAQIREDIFGASGDSNDMDEVLDRLRDLAEQLDEAKKANAGVSIMLRKLEDKVAGEIKNVESIKSVQGKRVCAKAGVK